MKSSVLKGVYTIAAGNGFLNDLAHGLKTAFADEKLARTRIYLPTRRACRDLTEAFLGLPDSAGLLPRAYPLGDVDEDELTFSALEPALTAAELAADLPPAISSVERNFFLAKLIQAKHASENKSELPLAGALRLADALGKFLDDLAIEQTDAATIRTLQSDQFAEHWQKVMKFLEIVIDVWPAYLEENGRIDSATRRVKLLEAQATIWRELPPNGPILIAGSTGSLKSTRALMKSLLAAQEGIIVLPGFEQETDPDEIAAILTSPTHPQHVMMKTLEDLQLSTSDVKAWPAKDREQTRHRRRFIQEAMRPAEKVSEWRNLKSDELVRGIQGIRRVDAPNEETEARVIALWLREQAENGPAALATSDRKLARRVASELKRWNIEADDSAGQPLIETPAGTFLRLIALATAPEAGILDLLALLKHPLTAGGMSRGRFRRRARALEIKVWRNDKHQRRARDLETTVSLLREEGELLLANFAEHILNAIHLIKRLQAQGPHPLSKFLEANIRVAETLATDDVNSGASRLWQGESGEVAANVLSELLDVAESSPPLLSEDYPEALTALLAASVVRPRRTITNKIAILGVLEARLGGWPAIALGGLEEGVWPRAPSANPWLSRGMRLAVGMSDTERRVGLSAHDFTNLLCLPNVLLTHSSRRDGAPTKPSRWLSRLDAVTAAAGTKSLRSEEGVYLDWALKLDPSLPMAAIPAPDFAPPIEARPRRLSVSSLIRLREDPYAVYAERILGVKPLRSVDPAPSPADRGTIVHAAYERFLERWPASLPPDIQAALIEASNEIFSEYEGNPDVAVFWRPAFSRAARWAAKAEPARRDHFKIIKTHAELQGEATMVSTGGIFHVHARADRIDILASGAIAIADIKTGATPSRTDIQTGKAPQLPLEAAIALYGEFSTLGHRPTEALSVWKLGGRDGGNVVELEGSFVKDAAETVWEGLKRLISGFDNPNTPYLSEPRGPVRYSDYRVLARLRADLGDDT